MLTFVAFRFPGTDSPDFAPARVLSDVLSSQRANLYALVPQGKALDTAFALLKPIPKASAAFALAYLPGEADAAALNSEMKNIVINYATNGVPADLVDAAKKGEIAGAEFAQTLSPILPRFGLRPSLRKAASRRMKTLKPSNV